MIDKIKNLVRYVHAGGRILEIPSGSHSVSADDDEFDLVTDMVNTSNITGASIYESGVKYYDPKEHFIPFTEMSEEWLKSIYLVLDHKAVAIRERREKERRSIVESLEAILDKFKVGEEISCEDANFIQDSIIGIDGYSESDFCDVDYIKNKEGGNLATDIRNYIGQNCAL